MNQSHSDEKKKKKKEKVFNWITPKHNERRAMKKQLGLHGKRKTKYRKAGLTGWVKGE